MVHRKIIDRALARLDGKRALGVHPATGNKKPATGAG